MLQEAIFRMIASANGMDRERNLERWLGIRRHDGCYTSGKLFGPYGHFRSMERIFHHGVGVEFVDLLKDIVGRRIGQRRE